MTIAIICAVVILALSLLRRRKPRPRCMTKAQLWQMAAHTEGAEKPWRVRPAREVAKELGVGQSRENEIDGWDEPYWDDTKGRS